MACLLVCILNCARAQCFGPLAFYDVPGRESTPRGSSSLVNKREAEMALALCSRLLERYPHLRTAPAVAVISPYQAQVPSHSLIHAPVMFALTLGKLTLLERYPHLRTAPALAVISPYQAQVCFPSLAHAPVD